MNLRRFFTAVFSYREHIMDYRATILLYCELLFALALLWREGLLSTSARRTAAIGFVALAFVLRYCCLTYETLDYQDWLRVWLSSLREAGAWKGLGQEIWSCNYNSPYLYFLAIISTSNVSELLLIKLVSIFFDVLLAYFTMRLVGVFTDSPARKLVAFCGVLLLPTVYLNGAFWGQCDVIYASFAVLAVYLALTDRPGWSVAAAAVSVSFKLQGIFLLPLYPALFLLRRMKLKHFFVFPAVYILTILPAVLAGRDFWELLTLYYRNTSTIGSGLNYNSSSLYSLIDFTSLPSESASLIGIILAFFLCASMYVWILLRRNDTDHHVLLGLTLIFCLGVPYLLPHMHDRYFFMSDVLSFALAVIAPAMSLSALFVSFGSFLGYHAYLLKRFFLPMRWGGVSMLLALISYIVYTSYRMSRAGKNSPDAVKSQESSENGDLDHSEKNILTNDGDLL